MGVCAIALVSWFVSRNLESGLIAVMKNGTEVSTARMKNLKSVS